MNPACPWLPAIDRRYDHALTRRHGAEKGAGFYRDALCYAQSQWVHGKPAQAVLQLNKAWMADLAGNDPVLREWPPPYRALAWILAESADGSAGFLGNPVRHFQHLASRVSGVRREVRSWRAWCCFHLAEKLLDGGGFSRDGEQLAREGIWLPAEAVAIRRLRQLGWPGESELAVLARDS